MFGSFVGLTIGGPIVTATVCTTFLSNIFALNISNPKYACGIYLSTYHRESCTCTSKSTQIIGMLGRLGVKICKYAQLFDKSTN